MEAGEYHVALEEIEGYYTEKDSITVTVKDKIEYVEVEIEDEIKSDAEVSPSEDVETSDNIVVENTIKDTVTSLDSTCVPTEVNASSLNKEKYITSKASLGNAVTKTLPENIATALKRNLFFVGTEAISEMPSETPSETPTQKYAYTITHKFPDGTTKQQTGEDIAGTSIPITDYSTEGYVADSSNLTPLTIGADPALNVKEIIWSLPVVKYTYIITHKFPDGTTKQQTGEDIAGTSIPITDYSTEGYITDINLDNLIIQADSSLNIREIIWTKQAPETTNVSYEIIHIFSDGKATETQNDTAEAGTIISINDYSAQGYKTDGSNLTDMVLSSDSEANKRTITWEKVLSNITPVKVSMPQTATMFVSQLNTANQITLTITVEDTNTEKVINTAGISWSLKDDSVGGITLSTTTGTSVVAATTMGTSKAGKVTVVASIPYKENGNEKTTVLECVVTVQTDSYNETELLNDESGRILYTDKNCTTRATVKDLVVNNVQTFYTEPKYTGWQTLNGKLYYYNENNQPVTGTQVISGVTYTFGPDGALTKGASSTGIDVSKWQGNIDWNAVKSAGIEFAIIRVGYRGSQTGVLVEDPYFRQNINGATAAGIKIGVYFFTQAITEAEAVEEASMALALTQGYQLAYPIFIDSENGNGNARANGLDNATRTACINAFCKTIQNGGRTAGIYASRSWYGSKLDMSQLNNYCIWVAQYNTKCTYTGRYSIWQYTSKGSIPGIKGNVDLNISYM